MADGAYLLECLKFLRPGPHEVEDRVVGRLSVRNEGR